MSYVRNIKEKKTALKASFILLLVLGNILCFLLLLRSFFSPEKKGENAPVSFSKSVEIQGILQAKTRSAKEKLYLSLIERVGPEKAQIELYTSGLPYHGESHMVNHTVGDWLYKKYGAKGVIYCKDYFLGSCYHGVFIPLLAEKGISSIKEVMKICDEQSVDTPYQCAHGAGHGLLSWVGYKELPKALKICDDIVKSVSSFPAYNCHDGVFMENIWAVHNNGEPDPDRWFDENDPLFPCNSPKIANKYQKACWSNQPHVLYQQWQGDISRVSKICDTLTEKELQETCIDALARQITTTSNGSMNSILALCFQTGEEWNESCLAYVARSYYSMGDRKIPFSICSQISQDRGRKECYFIVQDMMAVYSAQSEQGSECELIPQAYLTRQCKTIYDRAL